MSHALKQLIKVVIAAPPKVKCAQSASSRHIHRYVLPTLKALKKRQDEKNFFYKGKPIPPPHRNTYIEWNYSAELYSFGKRLGENLDGDLLRQALTHRSYVLQEAERLKEVGMEPEVNLEDNSKMVEEGEELMSKFIFSYLRAAFPKLPEEGICTTHDYLMAEETLAHISNSLGTAEITMCQDYPIEKKTLAKTLKALVACVLKSSGLMKAHLFVRDFILPQLAGKDISSIWWIDDPHEALKTILKNEGKPNPEPRLVGDSAKNTMYANFRVALYVDKEFLSVGCGETIDTAHEMAAHNALRRLFGITEHDRAFPFDLDVEKLQSSGSNCSIKDWSSKLFRSQTVNRIASSA